MCVTCEHMLYEEHRSGREAVSSVSQVQEVSQQ